MLTGLRNTARQNVERVLPFLRRWVWLIVLIGVIPVVVIGTRLRPTYIAVARVQMRAPADVNVALYQKFAPYNTQSDVLTIARTNFIQSAYSPQVRVQTLTTVGIANADPAYLPSVLAVRGSDFIDVSVEARTAELAAIMANAHANATIAYVTDLRGLPAKAAVAFLTDQVQAAQAELDAAQSAAAATPQSAQAEQNVRSAQDYYTLTQSKLDEARIKSITAYSAQSIRVIEPAVAPVSANTRKVQTQIAVLGLGGLVSGVLIAMLLDALVRKATWRRMVPSLSAGGRLKVGVLIGGGLLASAIVAAVCYAAPNLVTPQLGPLGIGVPVVWLMWKRPDIGLLGLVSLTAGLLPLSSLYVPLPAGGVFGYDLILIGLLGLLAVRALIHEGLRIEWWPVSLPLLVFLALAIASVAYAVTFRDADFAHSLNELRPLIYCGAAIVVAMALTRPAQRTTLLIGLFILSDVVSTLLIIQQFVGTGHLLLPAMAEWQVNGVGAGGVTETGTIEGSGFGLVRIIPPSNLLMFMIMVLAFVWAVAPGLRPGVRIMCAAQCAFLNVGLLLTYTRAQWIASVLSVIIIAVLVPHTLRVRLAHGLLAVLGLCAFVFALSQAGVQLPGAVQPAVDALLGRATSILSPDATLNSSSLQWRAFENEEALNSLIQSPLGVGLGNTYRAITTYAGEAAGYQGTPLNGFMHDSYLYIAVKTGLQGLAAFLWFCLAFVLNGWKLFRKMPNGPERWLVLAVLASFVGIMQWSVTEPNFMQIGGTVTVGLMVGLLMSLTRPQLFPGGDPPVVA